MDPHLISASCTSPSQDLDWHQARVEQSALALVLVGDNLLFSRALEALMGAVAVSVDCLQHFFLLQLNCSRKVVMQVFTRCVNSAIEADAVISFWFVVHANEMIPR